MIFVIVIMGILAKFGAEIFRNVYLNYNQSVVNNDLQARTESVIEQIGNRLQYRIKNSVVASRYGVSLKSLASADNNATVLEWVGYDIDGWLGDGASTNPTWSGFIDVDDGTANINSLVSPASDFRAGERVDDVIVALSGGASSITDAAIFFTGANNDVINDFGWGGTAQNEQNNTAAHLITVSTTATGETIVPGVDDFSEVDVYEQYKLSWTAYALVLDSNNTLRLHYNYQPWLGETYANSGSNSILMENVNTFKFQASGDMIKIQVCVNDGNLTGDGGYSLCKEKAIF